MTSLDGRTARRDRNSETVLDTVLSLFEEGNLVPTVEQVAERSGVSLRSVYRYFEDMDALLRAAIGRRVDLVEPLFVLPQLGEGPLERRISRLVDHRLTLYASMRPVLRAALMRAPHAPLIAAQVAHRRGQLSAQVLAHFAPELAAMGRARGSAVGACVDVLCEFESMEHLREQQGLSAARTRKALITGVSALLAPGKTD